MKDQTTEPQPAAVPATAKQAGEIRARWAWVEPAVGTEGMVTALEQGVKGDKWFSLMDQVYALDNLRAAFTRVKANGGAAGVDHQTIAMFEHHREENLERLAQSLKDGSYRPQAIRRVWIPKLGSKEPRGLGIPTVRDRVAPAALRQVLEPICERTFAEHSYGFRPNREAKEALRRVDTRLKDGYNWGVDADLKSYFDPIPWRPLLARVSAQGTDGKVLQRIEAFLTQKIMDTLSEWTPTTGTPQGAVRSPRLSNRYRDPLDHRMAQQGFQMVGYADDLVIRCRSAAQAEHALQTVPDGTRPAGWTLHPEKTRSVDARQPGGFDFLG